MSQHSTKKPLAIALGAAFVTSLAATPVANAAENPFAMSELSSGYLVAEMAGGKCGEGKCGGNKTKAEGKCGEGKCGGDSAKAEGDSAAAAGDSATAAGDSAAAEGDKAKTEGE
jgi:uncharacterized low-complexity protein